MNAVEEIKQAIGKLSLEERAVLARWMHGWHDDEWDRQIAKDVQAGKLDHVLEEVVEEHRVDRGLCEANNRNEEQIDAAS